MNIEEGRLPDRDNSLVAEIGRFADQVPGYYLRALADFLQCAEFRGKRVLEIGGSALPRELVNRVLGATQWVCVDILDHDSGRYQRGKHGAHYREIGVRKLMSGAILDDSSYLIFDGSAADLPASFVDYFDVVFSVNCFEHVGTIENVIERIHQSLKPDGILFSQFGPIWSGVVGNHYWVSESFNFNLNIESGLPGWAHLLYGKDEIVTVLDASGVSEDDKRHYIYQTYESKFINRLFFEDYARLMENSSFHGGDIRPLWARPVPREIQQRLELLYPGHTEFSAYGLRIVSRKGSNASVDSGTKQAKSILVTGAGRSGTSCLAGLFSQRGFFQGEALYPENDSNPKGFFENAEVNAVNERLIASSVMREYGSRLGAHALSGLKEGQFWLAQLPCFENVTLDTASRLLVHRMVRQTPFCYKDPRFSFTAEAWLVEAPKALVMCVFRDPATTVESILKECRVASYLHDFRISVDDAFEVWRQSYLRLLRLYARRDNVFFVRYADMFDSGRLDALEQLVGARLNREFPETAYFRSQPRIAPDDASRLIFETLETISAGDFGADREAKRYLVTSLDVRLAELSLPPSKNKQPGLCFDMETAPPHGRIRPIFIELRTDGGSLVDNFVDHIKAGWYDPDMRRIRLQFQLVALCSDADSSGLRLCWQGSDRVVLLPSRRIESPYVGKKYPELSWAGQSRFVIDTVLDVGDPDSNGGSAFDLIVVAGDRMRTIGSIRLGEPCG